MAAEPLPRPRLGHRLRRHAARAVPAIVWLAGCALALWLYERQHRGLEGTGFAVAEQVAVAGEAPGRLSAVGVLLHDEVVEGQVLAALDGAAVELALQAATAELERLRAELNREQQQHALVAGTPDVDRANRLRQFARDREATQIDYLGTLARHEEDRVRLQGLALELQRQRALAARGLVPDETIDDVETRHAALEARVAETRAVLAAQRAQRDAAAARFDASREDAPPATLLADVVLEPLRWAVKAQEARLQELSLRRTQLVLRAPRAGVVAEILARAGEVVAAGEPVVTLVEPIAREIVATLDEELLLGVRRGTAAWIERRADRTRARTTVLRRSPRVERIADRITGDRNAVRYGVRVWLRCPPELESVPGEAFAVTLLR